MDNKANNKYQVFFIVSHLEVLDSIIKYDISTNSKGLSNFSERLSIKKNNKENVEFIVKVFSFSLNEKNKNKTKAEIVLNGFGSAEFIGIINYAPKKNNFIYDFSFDICHQDDKDIEPPNKLYLTKNDQLNIFIDLLKNDESLLDSLLEDSFNYLKKDKDYYYIDFYLSLLVNSYLKKSIMNCYHILI